MRTGQLFMVTGLLLFLAQTGCQQHGGLAPGPLALGPDAAPKLPPHDAPGPDPDIASIQTVSTVLNPEGSQRPISLKECIALALENGRVGTTNIRVLAYDPASVYTNIEEALAKFDTRWLTGMTWSAIDEPAGNVFSTVPLGITPTLGTTATGVGSTTGVGVAGQAAVFNTAAGTVNVVDAALFSSTFQKLLPTGGLANITFQTAYTNVTQPTPIGEVNPTYRPELIFGIEQPLLRGAGVALNNSALVVTRLNFDQEREKFCAAVNTLLFSVEKAYWDLYFAYWNLHTIDTALRQAHDAWQVAKQLREKGEVAVQDLAALELQYQNLRLARMNALGGGASVLESERQLRFVVGLPPEDGCRLIPVDRPSTAPLRPDWCSALHAALETRPELIQMRQEVQKLRIAVKQAKNLTLPDLRALANYNINGLGDSLDGPGSTEFNALRSMASNHFNDWTLGLSLDIAIGARAANAQLRRANLQLAARMTQLRDMEKQATFALQQSYRDLLQASEVVRIQSSIRKAATERYEALYQKFRAGLEGPNFLLIAQQQWMQSLASERASIFNYNIALAKFELEKGTIQQYDNVSIGDAPLPAAVAGRASVHLSDMAKAVVLRERAAPAGAAAAPVDGNGSHGPGPVTGPAGAEVPPSLPNLNIGQGLSGAPAEGPGPAPEILPSPQRPQTP